jgi:RNA polymerase sigma factor (sigma-70 family)
VLNPVGPPPRAAAVVAQWFDRHVDALYSYVARRVGSDLARDVVADTYRYALERFDHFDHRRGDERAWLFGIATNLVRRHWRTEERRLRTQCRAVAGNTASVDPLLAIEDGFDARRRLQLLVEMVGRLPADDRDLLVLIAWEGMSSVEAAAVLGIPGGTVRSRMNRIRAELRAHETASTTRGDR